MKQFLAYSLDTLNRCLWQHRDSEPDKRRSIRPKAFTVLQYLVEHSGRLVTQAELLQALWPDVVVEPGVLKSQIMEVRRTLGDNPKKPLYIETVPRRGYRFIASVSEETTATTEALPNRRLVGRDIAVAELRACLRTASTGQRQIVLITGEPGIGKTALVDELQRRAAIEVPGIRIARGQCVEGYGGSEPYYPMLEALGQLCKGSHAASVVDILATQAPTWLVQFPSLVKREHRDILRQEILGATRERMLREMGVALEAIAAETSLLLIFEDLQWVDHSTVDLLSAIARRRTPVKLMLIGTKRPVDMRPAGDPLKALRQDLLVHQLCHEIDLQPLAEDAVTEYLAADSRGILPKGMAKLVHRHSGGNPLFMVATVDHLTERGFISLQNGSWQLNVPPEQVKLEVPENLRQMIEAQIECLSVEEQRALEVASVAGAGFSASTSAAATDIDTEDFETLYEALARRHRLIRSVGAREIPPGSNSARYEFVHALYREVLYRRQPPRPRAKRHRRIAERLESLYSQQLSKDPLNDTTAELAYQFEHGLEWGKAVHYARLASGVALTRFSLREATVALNHALSMVDNLPAELRATAELQLLERRAMISVATYDPAATEQYALLVTKAETYGMPDVQVRALADQAYPTSWTSVSRCQQILDHAIQLNEAQSDPVVRAIVQATCHFWRLWAGGWSDDSAASFGEAGVTIEQSADRRSLTWYRLQQALLWHMSARYLDCRNQITREFPVLLKGSIDIPDLNLGLAHWGAYQLVRTWSAIFLGEWGAADREFEQSIESLERNGILYQANTLRLYRAWGKFIAHDFEAARHACLLATRGLDNPDDDPVPQSAFLPPEERLRLVTLGAAEFGLGNYDFALRHLDAVRQQMLDNPVVLNWCWATATEWMLAQVWVARSDLERATFHAAAMLDLTNGLPETTWRALALQVNAHIAVLCGALTLARQHLEKALALVSRAWIPVAAWQVHATATQLYELSGNSALATQHRELGRTIILKLAASFPPQDTRRKIFLTASAVAKVFGHNLVSTS